MTFIYETIGEIAIGILIELSRKLVKRHITVVFGSVIKIGFYLLNIKMKDGLHFSEVWKDVYNLWRNH